MVDGQGTRRTGLLVAACTAVISGVAVFLNSYGVASFGNPSGYTALKNSVAALVLIVGAGVLAARGSREAPIRGTTARQRVGLVTVAVIGGSIPFLLFFEGLARASSMQAAFIHKTLFIWVLLIAIPFLKERIGPAHLVAIALLLGGQVALQGSFTGFGFRSGEWMILAATLLWSVEVVLVKKLLVGLKPANVALSRMVGGSVILLAYASATGDLAGVSGVSLEGWMWVVITGLILAGFVSTWFYALARAQAVDVTAILVGGAVITATLQSLVQEVAIPNFVPGTAMLAAGVAMLLLWQGRREARRT